MQVSGASSSAMCPHSFIRPSLRSSGIGILATLSLQLLMLAAAGSFAALGVIVSTTAAAALCDAAMCLRRGERISVSITTVIQGILAGMFLPESYPVLPAFLSVFVSFMVIRYTARGFAAAWMNPVAVAVALAFFTGYSWFPEFALSPEQLGSPNAALRLLSDGGVPAAALDSQLTDFLNSSVFKFSGVSVPEGYVSLFWDTGSAIPAFRFNVVTLLSSIVLVSFDFVRPLVPAVFLVVYLLLVRFFGPLPFGGEAGQGDILLAALTGGTLFSALYLIQWYGTTPASLRGKLLYGAVAGLASFAVAGCGMSPVGAVFAVLVSNMAAAVINAREAFAVENEMERLLVPKEG